MKNHRVTMRDIAKACGISVATVSYVLNHSEKEKITHETQLKVLETAARLHYEPRTPKTSKKARSGLVAVIITIKENNTFGKKAMYYDLAAELSHQLMQAGYETVLIVTKDLPGETDILKKHRLDAVFLIDIDDRSAKKLLKNCYVPILFLNCTAGDPFFCEIRPNFPSLFARSKTMLDSEHLFLVTEDFCCQKQMEQFTDFFLPRDIYINTGYVAGMAAFLQNHEGQKGVVLGDMLGMQVQSLFSRKDIVVVSSLENTEWMPHDMNLLRIPNRTVASVAVKILKDMISFGYRSGSNNCILLDSEPA